MARQKTLRCANGRNESTRFGKKLAGGCHSGRPIVDYVREAGWKIDYLEEGYLPGPKVLAYQYWGSAIAA